MTTKDKLIEEIRAVPIAGKTYEEYVEALADKLLDNDVIAPPCKVGQTVYVPWRYAFQRGVAIVTVQEIKLYDTNTSHFMFFIDMESDNECFNQSFGGWKTEQSIGKNRLSHPRRSGKSTCRKERL